MSDRNLSVVLTPSLAEFLSPFKMRFLVASQCWKKWYLLSYSTIFFTTQSLYSLSLSVLALTQSPVADDQQPSLSRSSSLSQTVHRPGKNKLNEKHMW